MGALFCDDFERDPSDVKGNWAMVTMSGGSLDLEAGEPSMGNALHALASAGATPVMADLASGLPSTMVTARATMRTRSKP